MPGPSRTTRRPAVAGRFYPASETECVTLAQQYVRVAPDTDPSVTWRGAIVPHAGWMFSGEIAGEAIATLAASSGRVSSAGPVSNKPQVVVVFGAVHTPLPLTRAAMDVHERWQVPGGLSDVPGELSGRLGSDQSELFGVDARFHEREHAVEVELPLIQRAFPNALVMPIEVPLIDAAPQIGIATARVVQELGLDAVYLASSDLTHYGTDFGFVPAGDSFAALEWARDNDRRLLDLVADVAVADVAVERIVPEVRERQSACGGGAIAAMLAACREHGNSSRVRLLKHETSDDVLKRISPRRRSHNAVGYAGVVVG
jgi:AmmeMemoRadiSam system protein B